MNKITVSVISILLVISVPIISYISAYNSGNRLEKQVVYQYEDLQNILSQYSLKISESVQVTKMYKEDFKDAVITQISSRYGEEGSQAAFQWLKENNINLDPSLYLKLQQMIEAGRNKFENSQTKFIDVRRTYDTQLGSFWRGTFLSMAGYPKIDLNKYQIVKSSHSNSTFESGVDDGLKIQ